MKKPIIILFFTLPIFVILAIVILMSLGSSELATLDLLNEKYKASDLASTASTTNDIKLLKLTVKNNNPIMSITHVFDTPLSMRGTELDGELYLYSKNKGDYNPSNYYPISQTSMKAGGIVASCSYSNEGCSITLAETSRYYNCNIHFMLVLQKPSGEQLDVVDCDPAKILKEPLVMYSDERCYAIELEPNEQKEVYVILRAVKELSAGTCNPASFEQALKDYNELIMIDKVGQPALFEIPIIQ